MYCDIFLVCINTQVNLDSFLSLDHAVLSNTGEYLGHGGGGGEFSLKIIKAMCRTVHCFWGPWKYYSGDLTHHYRLYGANHSTGDFSVSLIGGLHSS